jgi:hypothetical protein
MTARRRKRRSFAIWVALAASVMGGCAEAEPAPTNRGAPSAPTYSWAAGVQPNSALKPGVEDRVEPVLIGRQIPLSGVTSVQLSTEWMDDVVTAVCGNRTGNGVYMSAFGQRREWTGSDLTIQHFGGAFGAVTAAQAVEQPRTKLGCGTYKDRDGTHRVLGEVTLPAYAKTDGRLMFCEVVDEQQPSETRYLCTALLAREDIVSRIEVRATTRAQSEQVTTTLAALAARTLAAAW